MQTDDKEMNSDAGTLFCHFLDSVGLRHRPIMPKILPIMLLNIAQKLSLLIMLSKSRLCSKTGCFIRIYQLFLTALLE